jgi:hypothetical protein
MEKRGRKQRVMYGSVAQKIVCVILIQNMFFIDTHRTGAKIGELEQIEEFNVKASKYNNRLPLLFPSEQHLLLSVAKA